MILFESVARPLLFLHLIAAACVAGSAIHLAIRVNGYIRGKAIKIAHERLYARLLVISYVACFLLGAAIYPTFRIRVRHDYFDQAMPWATALFEVKEHLATVGLLAAIGAWMISREMPHPADDDCRNLLKLYGGLIVIVLLIVGFNIWSGWYLTILKPV